MTIRVTKNESSVGKQRRVQRANEKETTGCLNKIFLGKKLCWLKNWENLINIATTQKIENVAQVFHRSRH